MLMSSQTIFIEKTGSIFIEVRPGTITNKQLSITIWDAKDSSVTASVVFINIEAADAFAAAIQAGIEEWKGKANNANISPNRN